MQMPCSSGDISKDFHSTTLKSGRCNMSKTDDTSLHNKVAEFVLDLQSDVTLEDLLENRVGGNRSVLQPTPQQQNYQKIHLNEQHCKALRQLYEEIKNQQSGTINAHEGSSKRRSSDGAIGFGKTKALRNTESSLLQDTDCMDENWLMSLAAQLGLDKNMDLPELNLDLVKELI